MSASLQSAAQTLLAAYASFEPCAPIRTMLDPAAGEAEAYRVQALCVDHWLSAGRRLTGRKIGLTAAAVQQQLGVDQPDYGALFADMARGSGEPIGPVEVLQPRVEAEIAIVLERDLTMEQPTAADVLRAAAFALPAIEVVGSRIAGWDIKLVDTVADNASSGLYVLGTPARTISGLDFAGCTMAMTRGEEVVARGTGSDCLGSPLNAAVWLARRMAALGSPLRAGDTVMTGALGRMVPVKPGDVFVATIEGLGPVEARFAEQA